MPAPLPDDKRAAILADIKAGKARNVIAREHGVSPSTVTRIAQTSGWTTAFDRSQTKNATAAAIADSAARRARLAQRLVTLAELSLNQAIAELSETTARDAAVVLGIAVDKHLAIERHDSGADADQAASLLGAILNDLQARHGDTPSE